MYTKFSSPFWGKHTFYSKILLSILGISLSLHSTGSTYFDLHTSLGRGRSTIESESKYPDVNQYSLGATLGLHSELFYYGISADYTYVDQVSQAKNPYGNRRGTRTNIISPTIGFNLIEISFKIDFQVFGTYDLENKTIAGEKLSYKDPRGFRYYAGSKFSFIPLEGELGIFYESIKYKTEIIGSSENKITRKMVVQQLGLMMVFPL